MTKKNYWFGVACVGCLIMTLITCSYAAFTFKNGTRELLGVKCVANPGIWCTTLELNKDGMWLCDGEVAKAKCEYVFSNSNTVAISKLGSWPKTSTVATAQ